MAVPLKLKSNEDLYKYLLSLSDEFSQRGDAALANELKRISQLFFGSPSEFLYESESLLRRIRTEQSDGLTNTQFNDLSTMVALIEDAFRRIGGA